TTRVAIGASIWESDNLKFDFRKWMTHAEIGLNKAIARDWNCCVLSKGDEADLSQLNALAVPPSTASVSTGVGVGIGGVSVGVGAGDQNAHKHQSTLSRFATASLSQSNLLIGQQGNLGLTTEQIQQSLQLYDKLQRLESGDKDSFIALSLVRSYVAAGAHYNFQNYNDNGNTLLMLSIIKPLPMIILYLSKKVSADVNFDLPNADGNTALMLAIEYGLSDDVIRLLLSLTKDKNVENKVEAFQNILLGFILITIHSLNIYMYIHIHICMQSGKTALAIARQKERENIIRLLSEV
ncbi:hypothetical protein RFI_29889, partial [Reticulomyxa filosa]